MPHDNADAWDRLSEWYQQAARIPTDVVHYGPDVPTEAELRLCGDVRGRRVLELGCGGAQNCIALAKQGAHAVGVDQSHQQLAYGRRLAEAEGVRIELRQGELADLGFAPSGSVDLVLSAWAFGYVDDLNRVFRQVHRVLAPDAPFVFSLPHPASHLFDPGDASLSVVRPYWQRGAIDHELHGVPVTEYQHTIGDVFAGLHRANFRPEVLLEPEPVAGASGPLVRPSNRLVPSTLVVRARKLGV